MDSINKMNILVVGGGSIGKRHIKNLQSLGFSNIWVLKRAPDESFAKEFNVGVVTNFAEAKKAEPQCIFVCTPTSLHNDALRFAKENHCHVFMEKPLIHDLKGLEEAKSIWPVESANKVFFIGFMLRYHPLVLKIKELLDSRILGEVYNARFSFGSFLPYWHPWEDYKTSYASKPELGGGVINTITHELDLIQFFFGAPEKVYCEALNFNRLEIGVEEQCEAIFNYPSKVVTLHLDYLQKDYDRNIFILCENGKISWDWHDNKVVIKQHKAETKEITLEKDFEVNQLYIDELKDFFNLIENNAQTHSLDFNQAIENTELTLLMHQSANSGKKLCYEKSKTAV